MNDEGSVFDPCLDALSPELAVQLFVHIHEAGLRRHAADAADPYVHADYHWEDRQRRLIDALADGDDELARAFFEACFDITHDGVAHMVQTFNRIRSDLRGGE